MWGQYFFHARLSSSNSFIVHIICLPTLDYQINSHIKLGSWVKKRPGRKNFLWMDRSHKLCVYLKKTLLKCVFGGHQLHTTWTKKLEESTLIFFLKIIHTFNAAYPSTENIKFLASSLKIYKCPLNGISLQLSNRIIFGI